MALGTEDWCHTVSSLYASSGYKKNLVAKNGKWSGDVITSEGNQIALANGSLTSAMDSTST